MVLLWLMDIDTSTFRHMRPELHSCLRHSMTGVQLSRFETWLITSPIEIFVRLFSFFSIKRIHAMRRTSKSLHGVCQAYISIVWDMGQRFQNWFDDAGDFRRILYEANAVISGSQALQYFDRSYYPESDMDIFVRVGGAGIISHWLLDQSYAQNVDPPSYSYSILRSKITALVGRCVQDKSSSNRPLLGVMNFIKKKDGKLLTESDDLTSYTAYYRVQVVVVDIEPVNYILYEFHSSIFAFLSQ